MVNFQRIARATALTIGFLVSTQALATYHSPCDECFPAPNWKKTIELAAWFVGQRGDIRMQGREFFTNTSIGEVSRIDYNVQLHGEISNGYWGFFIDPSFVKISDSIRQQFTDGTAEASLKAKTRLNLVDFGAAYNLYDRCLCNGCSWLKFEFFGGGRHVCAETDVRLTDASHIKDSASWLGVMAGLRATWHVNCWFDVWGDVSASYGNVNHSFAGSVYGSYSFNPRIKVIGGFRYFDFCAKDGAGQHRIVNDVRYFGPVLGLNLNW